MAKKSKSPKTPPVKPPAAAVKAARRLNANYRFGRKLNRDTAPTAEDLKKGEAKYVGGVGYSNLQKMRQLAAKVTPAVWDALLQEQMQDGNMPLSWSHWVALVSAPDGETLKQVATQAAEGSWSSAKLRRHLQRDAGTGSRRPGTGRAIQAPGSVADGLQQLRVNLEVVRKRVASLRRQLTDRQELAGLADKLAALDVAVAAICEASELESLFEVPNQPHF